MSEQRLEPAGAGQAAEDSATAFGGSAAQLTVGFRFLSNRMKRISFVLSHRVWGNSL